MESDKSVIFKGNSHHKDENRKDHTLDFIFQGKKKKNSIFPSISSYQSNHLLFFHLFSSDDSSFHKCYRSLFCPNSLFESFSFPFIQMKKGLNASNKIDKRQPKKRMKNKRRKRLARCSPVSNFDFLLYIQ